MDANAGTRTCTLSAGKGFESPTLNELAYRPDGATGFNTTLQPQTSLQLELGAKWRDDALGLAVEAALFRADTDDEIGVLTNAGGRSTFQNVGSTRRSGAELGLRWQPDPAWRAQLAMTYLDATYLDSFQTCSGGAMHAPGRPGDRAGGQQDRRHDVEERFRQPGLARRWTAPNWDSSCARRARCR